MLHRVASWVGFLIFVASVANASAEQVTVRYRVECHPTSASPHWQINVTVSGLDPKHRDVEMLLEDWGSWSDVDSYYLTGLESRPVVNRSARKPERFEFDYPADWDGTIQLTYHIALSRLGSRAFDEHHLLPVLANTYSFGYAVNTLVRLVRGDENMAVARTIELVAPTGWQVVTGWGGLGDRRQTVQLGAAVGSENAIIVFGKPSNVRETAVKPRCEVFQFGEAGDITESVLDIVRKLIPLYGRNTGRVFDRPVRAFIVDTYSGGTHTMYGLRIGFDGSKSPKTMSPYFTQLIAHELFHIWLGGYLQPADDSLVWFFEGFTDYLSLWHAATAGLISKEWFAQRITELDDRAQASKSYGRIAFADPDVKWRDGDGPNETLAYKGGALLAFCMDARLRKAGHAGLLDMIRDFIASDDKTYSQETIRAWMQSHDLGNFYDRHVSGSQRMDVHEALVSFGYALDEKKVPLTYLGIRADRDDLVATVLELDPQGPAATAGIQVGDRIGGYFPTRPSRPDIDQSVDTKFRFGLNKFEPETEGSFIDVLRGQKTLQVNVEPKQISGGRIRSYRADKPNFNGCFECRL
ncbi:MAG: hypothetical protein MI923_05795 [Phycisphaerales bacterium]|nr:hypothetical protein [Phycisphaerales bacterium]